MSRTKTPSLLTPLRHLTGVRADWIPALDRLELHTVADLLFYFPRRYEEIQEVVPIGALTVGQSASVVGVVKEVDQSISETGRHTFYMLLEQDRHYLRAIWFNQPFLVEKFRAGQRLFLRGTVSERGGRLQMVQPRWMIVSGDQGPPSAGLLPVYGLTEGLKQRDLRRLSRRVVEQFASQVEEALPESLREAWQLCGIHQALEGIHFPTTHEARAAAERRLVFQELFVLQLALARRRHDLRADPTAPPLELTPKIRERILCRLPFELTESQVKAFAEIAADMARAVPMNRLLHGDVGSGKTAVALCAMLLAVAHGYQAALMAPTEILVRQHERHVRDLLAGSRVRLCAWTGSTSHRQQLAQRIESGEMDLVVGTQAIVQSELKFAKLGLIVIDEQHKFGVRQRARLKDLSAGTPHYLVMTATPIPRTISMTVFGDLDVSTLTMPAGMRAPIHTYLGDDSQREKWWAFVAKKLREGRQAYVIAPLVDAGEDSPWDSAERLYESLVHGPLESFRVDVLHGRQSPEEKDAALRAFAAGHTQVIVATSVVEVGIDVPNATVMTIESAERFGLSQLHQLRGRVARSQHPGFVCAFSASDQPRDNERLKAFAEVSNGFELAEIDMQLRGPGNLFSTEQTGFPPLRIADLVRDAEMLELARAHAAKLIESDPKLERPEHDRLRRLVQSRYGEALQISDVG